MLENKFKTKLVKEIEERFPGAMVFHLDPNERQGAPDLLVLYQNHWAALEGKKDEKASKASNIPLQDYYVQTMDNMSFSRFIYPENKEDVLNAMERSFKG